VTIIDTYGREHAHAVVDASINDYIDAFGT
jgi:hypothetical protein